MLSSVFITWLKHVVQDDGFRCAFSNCRLCLRQVTRLVDMTKHSVELTNDKKQRADQARESATATAAAATAARPNLVPKPAMKPVHIVPRPTPEPARPAAAPTAAAQTPSPASAGGLKGTDAASRAVFRPVVAGGAGRGLMHKFIASRGRLRPVSVFSAAPSGAGARELSPPRSRRPAPQLAVASTAARTEQTVRGEASRREVCRSRSSKTEVWMA